jgi:hypothetical protein
MKRAGRAEGEEKAEIRPAREGLYFTTPASLVNKKNPPKTAPKQKKNCDPSKTKKNQEKPEKTGNSPVSRWYPKGPPFLDKGPFRALKRG